MPAAATRPSLLRLADLRRGSTAVVSAVEPRGPGDRVAMRLEDLGFVPGEVLRVVSLGPIGGDPMVVQVGFTRFALRRGEAARILVTETAGEAA
jgi:ferrous iron transport protein A